MNAEFKPGKISDVRIASIDIVRGIVMIIMALDHVRDLMHTTSLTQNPVDLNVTTPALFFTRWITYLCAPAFVFLSGSSAYLSFKRHMNLKQSRINLIKRGLWLIVLEFTLVNFSLWFDFSFRILMLQVIAAIGCGLIVLSFLLKSKPVKIAIAALLIIFLHNLLQFVPRPENQSLSFIFNLMFIPGARVFPSGFMFFVSYPVIPWMAILLLGFACGRIFEEELNTQNKKLLNFGSIALVLFILLRILNIYGDPSPWNTTGNPLITSLSFLNVTKYPPSLLFDLLFLGIMFLLLRFSDSIPPALKRIFSVYGKVPLFYYLLHLYLIRLSVFIMIFAQGYQWKDLLFGPFQFGRPATGSGIRLMWIYPVCLAIVILLYPLCKWYGSYKERNRMKWWLKYL